jgi:pimeloyl-ACP methyl ester carboxylesterase
MTLFNTLVSGIAAALMVGLSPQGPQEVQSREHILDRDGQRLVLWEKHPGQLHKKSTRVVLLLHGATWSGRPCFDLGVAGYSTMQAFAQADWDTFSLDIQGYGRSQDPRGENVSEAKDAIEDVKVAVDAIRKLRGVKRVDLLGWSWGSQVAGLFAETYPQRTGRLVLYGSHWQPLEGAPPPPTDRFRSNSREAAASDFVPGCYEQEVLEAFVAAALAADPDSPNGSLRDYLGNMPVQHPRRISRPTLVILGEHEAVSKMKDQLAFFAALASPDKRFVIIPGGGHGVHLEQTRERWRGAVLDFLSAVN